VADVCDGSEADISVRDSEVGPGSNVSQSSEPTNSIALVSSSKTLQSQQNSRATDFIQRTIDAGGYIAMKFS